ncbi:unnamed protein product [Rotaria sp. Silwood1]|nr:unnamed protein product [Rotaria sp. Silwood1]
MFAAVFLFDDVFIPSVQAFRSLHQLYWNKNDLFIPRNEINLLEMLCHNNRSMINIEQYVRNLLKEFDINKSQYSSTICISLRQRFTNLAEQCQKPNASKQVITLIMKLVDHVYKLPDQTNERQNK